MIQDELEKIKTDLGNYIRTRTEIMKLSAVKQVAEIYSQLISNVVLYILIFFSWLFGAFALASYLNDLSGSQALAYGIVMFIHLVIVLIYLGFFRTLVERRTADSMVNRILNDDGKEDQNA